MHDEKIAKACHRELRAHGYDDQSHEPGRRIVQKAISWVVSLTAHQQDHEPHFDERNESAQVKWKRPSAIVEGV